MAMAAFSLKEDYWENFELQVEDIEFLYNHLLETETPLTSQELVKVLAAERIRKEKLALEQERISGGDLYRPEERYSAGQRVIFPALNWRKAQVVEVREGHNPDLGPFEVIKVAFENGEQKEFAAGLAEHKLNAPLEETQEDDSLDLEAVLEYYGEELGARVESELEENTDFVRIAGKWFPRALLVDINIGHLNLAEAVLDMDGGGPLPTARLIEGIGLASTANPRLLEFSMDLALQEDPRFDEVGSAGKVLWFLQRLEPEEVLEPPIYLRYSGLEYDRTRLTPEMLTLERELDDELSPLDPKSPAETQGDIRLIFPHWRAGTLPLSSRVRQIFPTAYEAPRILFTLVDGDTGERMPAWVVRAKRYVYGLKEWYQKKNLIPGSILHLRKGEQPGEVVIRADTRRTTREWIRTVLVGSDGGIVFAMLKQPVSSTYEERLALVVPDPDGVDEVWARQNRDQASFERAVFSMVRELAKLTPQSHVHAAELYAALNVVRRCPPGPLLALLASHPSFTHIGDLYFRLAEPDEDE